MKAPWEPASRPRRCGSRGSLCSTCSTASFTRGAPPISTQTSASSQQHPPKQPQPSTPHLGVCHILLTHTGKQGVDAGLAKAQGATVVH